MRLALAVVFVAVALHPATQAVPDAVNLSIPGMLENFATHRFEFRFFLEHNDGATGGLRAPTGEYYLVEVGDYIGPNHGRVVSMNADEIVVVEIGQRPDASAFEYQSRIPFSQDGSRNPNEWESDDPSYWRVHESKSVGIVPSFARNKEPLESAPLQSLVMRGIIAGRDHHFALIEDRTGALSRARVGNYLGRNHGRIISVDDAGLELNEIIPDGHGGWRDRRGSLGVARGSHVWYARTLGRLFTAAAAEGNLYAMRRLSDLYSIGNELVLDRAQVLGSVLAGWETNPHGPVPRPPEPVFSNLSEHEILRADKLADQLLHGRAARDGLTPGQFTARALPFGVRHLIEPENEQRFRALITRRWQIGQLEQSVAQSNKQLAKRFSALRACGIATHAPLPTIPPTAGLTWRGPLSAIQQAVDARVRVLQHTEDHQNEFASSLATLERECVQPDNG